MIGLGLWTSIYVIAGAIHLVFTWDEDLDEHYGNLRAPQRYLLVVGAVICWVPLVIRAAAVKFLKQSPPEDL